MDFNTTLTKLIEGNPDVYKKYPKALFPETKAKNMKELAKKRLEKMKKKKSQDYDIENELGAPTGRTKDNNY